MEPKSSKIILSKEKDFYLNCNLLQTSTEGRLIAINEKNLALANKSSGQINIVDSNSKERLKKENLISIDNKRILDMEFSPFDNNILAYVNENNSVIISKFVEEKERITSSFDEFKSQKKRLNFVNFNPVASNIMCSGTIFGHIDIWDSTNLKVIYRETPKLSNNLMFLLWSPNGNSIGSTTFRKSFFNIFDIRENKYIIQNQIDKFSESRKIYFNWIDDTNIVALSHNDKKKRIMILFDIGSKLKVKR